MHSVFLVKSGVTPPLSRMPCFGPIRFLFDDVCFLAGGLGLALGSGTMLLGTGEVKVGAYDVEETGSRAPTGRARRQSAPARTQTRGDERMGGHDRGRVGRRRFGGRPEGAWSGEGGRPSGYGGWVDMGWVTKILRFLQKCSPNCDFYGRSTFFVIMQPYGWVRREG
jgi:hypothetical protein